MSEFNICTKVTKDFEREDASVVRLVVETFFGAGLKESVNVYGLLKASPDSDWAFLSNTPAPGWREMAVVDYLKHGRSPLMQHISNAELLCTLNMLGKPLPSA